jgi:hypothetical protein
MLDAVIAGQRDGRALAELAGLAANHRPPVELPDPIDGFDTLIAQVIIAYVG